MHDRIRDRRRAVDADRLAQLRQGLEELAGMLGPSNEKVRGLLADAMVACRVLQDRVAFGVVTPADFLNFVTKYQDTLSEVLATLLRANPKAASETEAAKSDTAEPPRD